MHYILEKSMLTSLVDSGCKKNVINMLDDNWKKKWKSKCSCGSSKDYKDCCVDLKYSENYVSDKLGLKIPMKDKAPLVAHMQEGEIGEFKKIEELSFHYDIITELSSKALQKKKEKKRKKEEFYIDILEHGDKVKENNVLFNSANRQNLKEVEVDFDSDDFMVDFSSDDKFDNSGKLKGVFKKKFKEIINPDKYDFIYQFQFRVDNEFFYNLIKNKDNIIDKYKSINIRFNNSKPDLIKVIRPSNNKRYKVFNEQFEIKETSNLKEKIILQVCDIKTSEFKNKHFIELILYALELNSFIYKNNLADKYAVLAEGIIFPQDNSEDLIKRETRINNSSYLDIEKRVINFKRLKEKIIKLFRRDLLDTINIIEMGLTSQYNDIKISGNCFVCDYYGDQNDSGLKKKLKEKVNIDYDEYISDPQNNFCKYIVIKSGEKDRRKSNVNNLPCLKVGEKNRLLKENINNFEKLFKELEQEDSKLFTENKSLEADRRIIENHVKLMTDNNLLDYKIIHNKTLNLPKFSNLTIFIDEQHDPHGQTLSISYDYQFYGKGSNGGEESKFKFKPYVPTIVEHNKELRDNLTKRTMIDFLIKLNETITQYENFRDQFGNSPTFSIIYWGEKRIEHIKELFLEIFDYITPSDDFEYKISLLYKNLKETSPRKFKEKMKKIKDLRNRFYNFFSSDDELDDYRIIEKSPFFDMKKAVEDLFAFNLNINITVDKIYNQIVLAEQNKGKDKKSDYEDFQEKTKKIKEIYYKPDSDDFNGRMYSRVFKVWDDLEDKKRFEDKTLKRLLRDRLFQLIGIWKFITRAENNRNQKKFAKFLKGVAPHIPISTKPELFNGLEFGNDLLYYHKLDSAYSLIEKETIHKDNYYRKIVLGKALYLKKEIRGKDKNKILDDHFKDEASNYDYYKVYKIPDEAVDANYDENSFGLTIYPSNQGDCLDRKISNNENENIIYSGYDDFPLSARDIFKWVDGRRTTKNYKDIVKVSIEKFDRFDNIIIIKLDDEYSKTKEMIEFFENNYEFNYKENVLLEQVHIDIWERKLKDCLEIIEKNVIAKNLLEEYEYNKVNSYNDKSIKDILTKYYGNCSNILLDNYQIKVIENTLNYKMSLLQGPPGTGKSHTVAHLLLTYYLNSSDKKRILLMGNYDATDNLITKITKKDKDNKSLLDEEDVSIVRIRSKGRSEPNFEEFDNLQFIDFEAYAYRDDYESDKDKILSQENKFQIFTSTPHQILKIFNGAKDFYFDLIIIDEASQMDVGKFVASLVKVTEDTQFLLAGDEKQLPPITKVKLKNSDKNYFGSVFEYYMNQFPDIIISPLANNRRSNSVIVDFSRTTFNYNRDYKAHENNKDKVISFIKKLNMSDLYDRILNPKDPMIVLNYDDGNSHQLNIFEAEQIINIIKRIFNNGLIDYETKQKYELGKFFEEGIGIVVPHKSQRTKIQNMLIEEFSPLSNRYNIDYTELREKIISAVDTVERFQGQERDIIICSYILGDEDIIRKEEEFIYNPNRLNVMVSRAKFKAIILASNELVFNMSNDLEIVDLQEAFYSLVTYCDKEIEIHKEWSSEEEWVKRNGILRCKSLKNNY
ncbi:DEAD/DEAH box helicase [Orenia marismortui]|uniref:AAA domain-containing protein n=1 Tax=Orenia marismortui TaxID=46469 RepID=A0A4R8H373_9FIRM|nr:AAA domain-containing protein [Orenia marismortui]TDX49146.1 AAA domain-containing protein [Orenia marismortui]